MVVQNKGGTGEACLQQTPPGISYRFDSIYFRDPNGQLLVMACYKFVPPEGYSVADVLATAHRLRVTAGAYNIQEAHLADAIAELTQCKAVPITEVVLK